jgi:hypothetical protein
VFEISNVNTASAIHFIPSLGQQVRHGYLQLDGGAGAQGLRRSIRPEQGMWVLAETLATETTKPIKKPVAKVLHQPAKKR